MDELNEKDIRELFRKVRAIPDPEHDLGDSLAERYLVDDLNKLLETTIEAEYERGYSDASDEAYDGYDMEDARDSGYEEGHTDGVAETKRKYNIKDDEE